MLSGFLIGQILMRENANLEGPGHLATFYVRRWFRTLPLFWLFLAINVLLEYRLRQHPIALGEAVSHGLFVRTFAHNNLTFFPESWSLAIEEWFYLLFPAALWIGLQFWKRFDRVFLGVAIGFYLFSTIGRALHALNSSATWAESQREIVIYRFDALMTGMLAAWIAARAPGTWAKHRLLCAAAGSLILFAMYATLWKFTGRQLDFGDDNFFARSFRFNCVSLGFALLLPWASRWRIARENAASFSIRRIALWSYALYLVHLPLLDMALRFVLPGWRSSGVEAAFLFVLLFALALTISALLYRFFESPCTRLREHAAPAVARWLGRF